MQTHMTMCQKIMARSCRKKSVDVGEIIDARVDVAMSHENAFHVANVFSKIGAKKVWDKERIVLLFDHRVPAESVNTANIHKKVREFAKAQEISNFYDMQAGVCHEILAERSHVLPGTLVAGTDSHTTMCGALNAMGIGIGATEMAGVWTTGKLWLKVPETIRFEVSGKFKKHVGAKDLVLSIIGERGCECANYRSIEFVGTAIRNMGIDGRMTMCNMAAEIGAKTAICEFDGAAKNYLGSLAAVSESRTNKSRKASSRNTRHVLNPIKSDKGADFEEVLNVDVSTLQPQIACPHSPENVVPVKDAAGLKIDQVVIGSCTNGRLSDLRVAAQIIGNKKVARGVRMIVVPASQEIYLAAIKEGIIETLARSGATIMNPGCGPCLGAHQGLLGDFERCVSTTNRNFVGRMGSAKAEIYLVSPAVAAASALKGKIAAPD